MSYRLLDPLKEPVFADLVTDPRFAQVANEFLQPTSYEPRHYVSRIGSNFLDHPDECNACAPHRIEFLASRANRAHLHSQPRRRRVVDLSEHPVQSSADQRETARSFGPPPKAGKRRKKGSQTDGQ